MGRGADGHGGWLVGERGRHMFTSAFQGVASALMVSLLTREGRYSPHTPPPPIKIKPPVSVISSSVI